jgi:hypothetical protein
MNWIKSRIVEPTSWLAVGVGAIVVSSVVPSSVAVWLMIAAAVTVAAGIILKEKGGQ